MSETTETGTQHDASELSAISRTLDFLNGLFDDFKINDMCFEGELSVFWVDVEMGKIVRFDDTWVYVPTISIKK